MTEMDGAMTDLHWKAREVIGEWLDDYSYEPFNAADALINALWAAGYTFSDRHDPDKHQGPHPFILERTEDVSGVSGIGIVAEGVEFTGGVVALRWLSDWPTSVVFHDKGIDSVVSVHGHDGRTRVVWQ
jgi:hypothetical protein